MRAIDGLPPDFDVPAIIDAIKALGLADGMERSTVYTAVKALESDGVLVQTVTASGRRAAKYRVSEHRENEGGHGSSIAA